MTVEKLIPRKLLLPTTTGENSAMSQSEFLAITCKLERARCDWLETGTRFSNQSLSVAMAIA